MTLSVIIPCYNERATVETLIRRVLAADAAGLSKQILVIDDASTDGSGELLARLAPELGFQLIRQPVNAGKGAAVRAGFAAATGDILLIQDADLEYDPADYPKLLAPILAGKADVVFGSRFIGSEPHRVLYFWHYAANRLITLWSNIVTNLNLTDMEVGLKAFTRDTARRITIEEDRFGLEPELTAKVARLGCRVFEVGISYAGRTYAEGKKIQWHDGLWALWCTLKYGIR
jgi:glycosyltransferase involved in cell wall biosynthesis